MKKLLALVLTLAISCALLTPALAAEAVTPTPPPWCPEEEYAVFPGSAAYEPETWEVITGIREVVRWGAVSRAALPMVKDYLALPYKIPGEIYQVDGNSYRKPDTYDLGLLFEMALFEVRLLYNDNGNKTPHWTTLSNYLKDGDSHLLDELTDQQRYALLLWTARGVLRRDGVGEKLYRYLSPLMTFPQFSLDKLTDNEIFTSEEQAALRAEVAAGWADFSNHIEIWLDGVELSMDVPPEARDGRTMVPIRAVAEALGADVAWVPESQKIVLTRAGSTVTMTLDSATATVDGAAVEMDVAPYATEGRTLIPARYVAEFFGQKVNWDGVKRQVLITEDKSVADGSNLEEWAIELGLIRGFIDFGPNYGLPPLGTYYSGDEPIRFGQFGRTAEDVQKVRGSLASAWGVNSREDLIPLIQSMTFHGHNDTFREMAADVKLRSEEERAAITAQSEAWPAFMWEYTEELDEKWGETGILAWDLSRMSNLAQWGYTAGYLTYAEALELVEPVARLTLETFSDWHEFYLNYLDGYNWWARNDIYTIRALYEKGLKETYGETLPAGYEEWMALPRANYYQGMINRMVTPPLLDDTLFQTGVIGLPE